MHPIELKFGMDIIGHRWMNPNDFGEYQMNNFFTEVQNRILIYYDLWSQILKIILVSKRCILLTSNLVYMCHCRTKPINFCECRIYSIFTDEGKKEFLHITAYGVKLLKVC